jgi:hypothetical protein
VPIALIAARAWQPGDFALGYLVDTSGRRC